MTKQTTAKFKNISGEKLSIPDFGEVEAGEIIEMPENFNNANFKKVGKEKVELKNSNEEEK